MVRQARCSGSGTKLKINSPATSRRSNRSASRKSPLRPRGARLEKACARCKRMYGSNSHQIGFQYCPVDSMTTSFTPCACSQASKRRRSLAMVPKRRRSSLHSGEIASPSLDPTTTISTFGWMSIDATLSLSNMVSSWRGSGRMRGKKIRTVTRYRPSRREGRRHTDWFKTRIPGQTLQRPQLLQSGDDLHRSTPAP